MADPRPTLDGKSIVVSGAGRGIGREMALAFSRSGADLTLTARTQAELDGVSRETSALGARTITIAADISELTASKDVVSAAMEEHGRIDVLVNNAGITPGAAGKPIKSILDVTVDYWDRTFAVNCRGAFLLTKETLPFMIARGAGSIVGITSGISRKPLPGYAPYAPSKVALELLIQIVDAEFAQDGIRANLLHPGGPVATSIFSDFYKPATGPLLSPDVIADAAVWLASDRSDNVHGEIVNASDWNTQHSSKEEE